MIRYYHSPPQIKRMLQMVSNLVVLKARDIVAESDIDETEVSS